MRDKKETKVDICALVDKKEYVIANVDKDGGVAERIYLTLDFHKRRASVYTPFMDSYPKLRDEFVFKDVEGCIIKVIGALLMKAGELAEKELKKGKVYKKL